MTAASQFRSTAFRLWEDRASVRRKPQRRLGDRTTVRTSARSCTRYCEHPLVASSADPRTPAFLLIRRLYDYLHFTTELETLAVIPVASMISRGRSGLPVSKSMRGDAYKIVTDEAWHAQFSYDLAEDVWDATGVAQPARRDAPAFLHRLDGIRARVPAHLLGLEALLFSVVSETLISGVLSELPRDERLPKPVRDLIRDHAEDEGRHHAYFRTVLRALWQVLTPPERLEVTVLVPSVIYAFLEPDYQETATALETIGLSAGQIEQVIGETWPSEVVARDVAAGASPGAPVPGGPRRVREPVRCRGVRVGRAAGRPMTANRAPGAGSVRPGQ